MTNITPLPIGAIDVGEWRFDGGNARRFWGTEHVIVTKDGDDVRAEIAGFQYRDGRIDRFIVINGTLFLYASEARQAAAHLLAAAEEMEAIR